MSEQIVKIENISFATMAKEFQLKDYYESLKKYGETIKKAIDLEEKFPIFIDTNILLKFYSVSFSSRKSLEKFLSENKKNIFITSQVQREFIKNREGIIDRFFIETLETIETNFKTEVKNKLQSYTDKNKIYFEDFPKFRRKIEALRVDMDEAHEKLKEECEVIKGKFNETKFDDKFLKLILDFNAINNLTSDETKFLKSEFDTLKKNVDLSKFKDGTIGNILAFPGLGDVKEKPDDPYGDYIIYHELVKYIKENNSSVIFLTYDTTKGDWVKQNKEPHSHYIQAVYLATGKAIYFVDADRFFNQHLNILLKSLIKKDFIITNELEEEFVEAYFALERIIKIIAEFVVIDNAENLEVYQLIEQFLEREYIDSDFELEFLSIMYIRNIILHAPKVARAKALQQVNMSDMCKRIDLALDEMNKLYSKL